MGVGKAVTEAGKVVGRVGPQLDKEQERRWQGQSFKLSVTLL